MEEKKNYEKPEVDIITIDSSDIVTTSTGELEWWGED